MPHCNFCKNKRKFKNSEELLNHLKRVHAGKLSKESIDYLINEVKVPLKKVVEFAKKEGVKIDGVLEGSLSVFFEGE